MVARFLECAVVTNWLPHILVQIFFHLLLVHKIVWCSLFSSSIQTRVSAVTFNITLLAPKIPSCFWRKSAIFDIV